VEQRVPMPSDRPEAPARNRLEELDDYISHSSDLLCVIDTAGRFVSVNPASERILGYVPPDMTGRAYVDFVHPDDVPAAERDVNTVAGGQDLPNFANRFQHRDGSYRWLGWSAHLVNGLIYASGRDITTQKLAEAAVSAQAHETAWLMKSMANAFVVWGTELDAQGRLKDFRFVYFNDAYARVSGLTLDDVRGRTVREVWPTTEQSWYEVYGEVARTGVPKSFEMFHAPTHGLYACNAYRPRDTADHVCVVFEDVTERRRDENALRLTNRQLRMIGDCNQALIRATDEVELLQTVCAIAVDVGGYRLAWVGFADDDEAMTVQPVAHAGFEDRYLEHHFSWADVAAGRGPTGTAIRSGEPCAIQDVATDERFAPWREGAIARGHAAVCALPLTADGRTYGALTVYSPVADTFHREEVELLRELAGDLAFGLQVLRTRAERSRAEASLRASEERFERLLNYSNDIIAVTDENLTQLSMTGPTERIMGYPPDELVGTSGLALMHPDDVGEVLRVFTAGLGIPGFTRRVEYRIRHKSGSWVPLETVGTNLLHDPAVRGVVLNIRDVSERKAAEQERGHLQEQLQQAMKMEAVGRLAGGIAHDFNNLLTAITGNLELVRLDLPPTDPVMPQVEAIGKAADSAALLTQQLLAFSRRQIIEPRVLNLNDLVEGLRRMTTRLIGEDITVTTRPAPDLGAVKVDPGQFDQVLLNLVVNARDAMPKGGVLVIETANVELDEHYCSSHPYLKPGPFVMLVVSDTGSGMSDDVKQHLFEPFFTTKPKGKGTGLGLATIFGAVKQADGTIEVYSEPGQGTTFKVYLPRVDAPAEKLNRENLRLDIPRGRETILLVEDEQSVRDVALAVLTRLGYRVLHAANGGEALMHAETFDGHIDLLMTDVVMPGMNGRELAERLLKGHPGVRVLYTSGYTEDVIVHHGVVDEDLQFIGKPYSLAALAVKVRETLDQRPARA
jgi:two-component system cell cycle sensor histidine kinase/response regulator CckA